MHFIAGTRLRPSAPFQTGSEQLETNVPMAVPVSEACAN